jgi:PAS domain S-box-containing protein
MLLIVDDKQENILPLRVLLEKNGFKTDSAQSGVEALKKILKNEYSLIILDVQMPEMNGFEVAEAIRGYSKTEDIPILFLSAVNIESNFVIKGLQYGAIDYLTKPVDTDIFLLKVKNFISLYDQKRELNNLKNTLSLEIEHRKQAQAELSDKSQELNSILNALPQIAFAVSPLGELEYINESHSDFLGENSLPEFHPQDNEKNQIWKSSMINQKPIELQVRLKNHSNGEYYWHLLRTAPIFGGGKIKKWIGTFTDIDEHKKSEKKKDEFLGIASHELKTPLTGAKAYAQLLKISANNNDLPEQQALYIKKLNESINKLEILISDLLDVSKIDSGSLDLKKQEINADLLVNATIENIRQVHPCYKLIKTGSVNAVIHADAGRIEQVLLNYITNAIKYSPTSDEVFIEPQVLPTGELEICVKDFGIGIPKDKQSKIFEKYYRGTEVLTQFQGLGIGLYVCAEIIKSHGGSYGVMSELGKGSTFYFRLPTIIKEIKDE